MSDPLNMMKKSVSSHNKSQSKSQNKSQRESESKSQNKSQKESESKSQNKSQRESQKEIELHKKIAEASIKRIIIKRPKIKGRILHKIAKNVFKNGSINSPFNNRILPLKA